TAAGATIRFQVHEAQRPPDSVRTGGGTVDARRGSVLIACSTPAGGSHPVCREGPAPGTWRQVVDAQIAGLRPFLTGPLRVYRVVALARDCFRLDLVVRATRLPPALALGARYCIDPGTQAVLSSSQRLAAAVITITATSVHGPATDADLALPAGATYER
ncbi:MAG TPA: hypothetical protein VGI06_17025, partial [Acidimicrobiales bacterium]